MPIPVVTRHATDDKDPSLGGGVVRRSASPRVNGGDVDDVPPTPTYAHKLPVRVDSSAPLAPAGSVP